jgi:hypothetical protein
MIWPIVEIHLSHKLKTKYKKFEKTHPEFTELGEIASEDGRKVIDHKQIVKLI